MSIRAGICSRFAIRFGAKRFVKQKFVIVVYGQSDIHLVYGQSLGVVMCSHWVWLRAVIGCGYVQSLGVIMGGHWVWL